MLPFQLPDSEPGSSQALPRTRRRGEPLQVRSRQGTWRWGGVTVCKAAPQASLSRQVSMRPLLSTGRRGKWFILASPLLAVNSGEQRPSPGHEGPGGEQARSGRQREGGFQLWRRTPCMFLARQEALLAPVLPGRAASQGWAGWAMRVLGQPLGTDPSPRGNEEGEFPEQEWGALPVSSYLLVSFRASCELRSKPAWHLSGLDLSPEQGSMGAPGVSMCPRARMMENARLIPNPL